MSKINDLIKELCPNGVRFDKLENVTLLQAGDRITTAMMSNNYEFDVIGGGTLPTGKYNDYNREHCVTISRAGSAGFVNWKENKFWATDVCFTASKNNDYMDIKFVYHYLKNSQNDLQQHLYGGSMPKLEKNYLWQYQIPIPPLEVQEEIVRILDKFGELEEKLEEELEARKNQYEFWRTNLLNNYKELKTVKDVLIKYCSGATPLKGNAAFYEGGTIPWLRTQEVRFNEINHTECFVTEVALEKTGIKFIPENCVIVAMSGASAGRCAINKIPLTTNQHCLNLEVDPNKANYKYVYYCICNAYGELLSKKEGARGDLNSSKIVNLKIPMPSLEMQNKIVSVLDKFDKLINDIAVGLPAEIELRRKQYEYYRNKLLSFKEI